MTTMVVSVGAPARGRVGRTRSDEDLVVAWCAGDAEAGDALLRRHARDVHAFVRHRVRCDQQACDLVQDALLACVEGRDRFDHAGSFRSYLFAIVRYRLIHFMVRDAPKRRRCEDGVWTLVDPRPSPQAIIEDSHSASALIAAIAELPASLRDVLELFYIEAVPTATIAVRLGVPAATVRTRLHRARARLAEQVLAH